MSKVQKRKVNTRFKKLIRDAVTDYRKILHLGAYEITVLYPVDEDNGTDRPRFKSTAKVKIDRRYLTIAITVFPFFERNWLEKRMGDEEVREVIAHELSHSVTEHMKDLIYACFKDEGEVRDAWEAATTQIGRMVYDLGKK